MSLLICPECGKQVSDKAEMCPVCGCPAEDILVKANEKKKQDKRRKIIIYSSIIVVLLVGIVLLIKIISQPDKSGYYQGITWDTTFEALKEELKTKDILIDEEDQEIHEKVEDFSNIEGVSAWITYKFDSEKLYEISIMPFIDEDKSSITYVELNKKLNDELTEIYGDSKQENSSTRIWNAENSILSIWSYKDIMTLTYTDSNHKED